MALAVTLLCTEGSHLVFRMVPGSLQIKQQLQNQLQIPPRAEQLHEILPAATINIHQVPQGAVPSSPLPCRWQGDSSGARDASPASWGSLEGQHCTAGSDVLQKRCHSPQPPCLGDLSKPAGFSSSAEPLLTRNANFSTSSFPPQRLLKEQGNNCSHWCNQSLSWVPGVS